MISCPLLHAELNNYMLTNTFWQVRDYIHVVDLARGHLAALKKLKANPGCVIYNLGTGVGYSVLDMVKAYSKVRRVCRGSVAVRQC